MDQVFRNIDHFLICKMSLSYSISKVEVVLQSERPEVLFESILAKYDAKELVLDLQVVFYACLSDLVYKSI